jgi:hypothetical protein
VQRINVSKCSACEVCQKNSYAKSELRGALCIPKSNDSWLSMIGGCPRIAINARTRLIELDFSII